MSMERTWAEPPRKIAILRALKLGDMLCAVPALRAIRSHFPEAEVVLVGLPWARAFVARFSSYRAGSRECPGYPGAPEQGPDRGGLPGCSEGRRAERFDRAVQWHGPGAISDAVTARVGATIHAGFYEPGSAGPDPETCLPYPGR